MVRTASRRGERFDPCFGADARHGLIIISELRICLPTTIAFQDWEGAQDFQPFVEPALCGLIRRNQEQSRPFDLTLRAAKCRLARKARVEVGKFQLSRAGPKTR